MRCWLLSGNISQMRLSCHTPTVKMKNFLRAVGIEYDMIHVCKNNCVLFQKDYANLSEFPKCKSSRWKDGDAVKRIPHNVLRHFPIYQDCRGCFMMLKQERM